MSNIHDYPTDATAEPIKALDYLDMDNEDGSGGYDVSKKILVSEFLTFITANLDPLLTGATTLVVAIGTSGTGVKGRWDRPYPTVTLAKAAATSGDTIVVFGNVSEGGILKNGVNYVIHGNLSSDGINAPLVDSSNLMVCNVTVHGSVISLSSNDYGAINMTNANSVLNLKCSGVEESIVTNNGAIFVNNGAKVEINGNVEDGANVRGGSSLIINGNVTRVGVSTAKILVDGADSSIKIFGSIDILSKSSLNASFYCLGNINVSSSSDAVELDTTGSMEMVGNITQGGTGRCISSSGGDVNYKGNAHSESGKCVFLSGDTIGEFDGNFSSNSQTASHPCFSVENNSNGKVTIKGNIDLTNALSSAGSFLARNSSAPILIFADVSSIHQKVVISTATSTGVRVYGTIKALESASNAHPVTLENSGVNTCVLMSSCVLIATHASAFGVSNDSNAVNQSVTNYGAVTNRMVDPDLAAAKVKALIHDSNVI